MIRIIVLAMIVTGLASCKGEGGNAFEVSGTVKNSGAKKIYLEVTPMGSGQRIVLDSANLGLDGSFHVETKAKEESLFTLYLDNSVYPLLLLVNDEPKVVVTADVKNNDNPVKIEGSPATTSLNEFMKTGNQKWEELNVIGMRLDSLIKANATDSLTVPLSEKGKVMLADFRNYVSGFVKNAKSPVVSVFPLNDRYGRLFDIQEYDSLINTIEQKFPEHKGIGMVKKAFVDQVAAMQQQQQQQAPPEKWTGKQAPEFTLPDLSGKNIALSSFKGKYLLVDFWASWCGPCRMENPNVVAAYAKFKSKNFTILGVSLDEKKDAWEEAVQKDGLTWAQVSDLKYWESSVVPLYGIEGIPYNVLLDPSGKIIAENLRGPYLEQKLQQVLQ